MTRLTHRALRAGLAASLLCAPLAFAQTPPNHDVGNQMPQGNMSAPPPEHMATPMQPQTQSMGQSSQQMGHSTAETHQWRHGQRFDGHRQVVHNWRQNHLRQPPHGYEWVQDGGQSVLISIHSGMIIETRVNKLSQ